MAERFINNLLLKELVQKKEKNEKETLKKINEEYEKMILNYNLNVERIVQLSIMEAEIYLHEALGFDFYILTEERIKEIMHYKLHSKLNIRSIQNIYCNLKKEDYIKNLHICPEIKFLYDNGFLEITDYDMHIYDLNCNKLFAFNILKEYLIFDLIKVVLNFM